MIGERDVTGIVQCDAECEKPIFWMILQWNLLPDHCECRACKKKIGIGQFCGGFIGAARLSIYTIVEIPNHRIVRHRCIEIGHQRGDVLRGRQPRMHVFAGVQESARSNGHITYGMSVEWEIEGQQNGLKMK